MHAYQFAHHSGVPKECPNAYDYSQILEKFKTGGYCNYGMEYLLPYGYIKYGGWCYVFRDKGELNHYFYLTARGDTGTAWAPNVKLLEKNLHHKIRRAFKIN